MIKVTKTTTNREITAEEFVRMKNGQPYKSLRSASKSVNFLCLFGGSPKVLAENSLETSWTPEMIENYLRTNDCSFELRNTMQQYPHEEENKQKCIAIATRIQDEFFKGYPGLKQRIKREQNYSATHGYCRTLFGASRNMIELWLRGEYDNKNMGRTLRNLENISANVRAQNHECCIRGRAQYELVMWLLNTGRASFSWNEIHDSLDLWVKKEEFHDVMAHAKHLLERPIPELKKNWVPLGVDCEVSDLKKGGYYKGGDAPEAFGYVWDDLELEDPDPFNVEQDIEFERAYFDRRKKHWEKKNVADPLQDKIDAYLDGKTETYYDRIRRDIKEKGFADYREYNHYSF